MYVTVNYIVILKLDDMLIQVVTILFKDYVVKLILSRFKY